MIVALFAALALQTAPDAATATLATADRCLDVMLGETEPPARPERVTLADGRQAVILLGRDGCSLAVDGWRDDSGLLADKVRDDLTGDRQGWTVSEWRQLRVNESGPTLWTTLVLPDVRRHSGYWIQIIEPQQGAPERLEISFGIDP